MDTNVAEMDIYTVCIWAAVVVVCSFIGFVIENAWIGIRYGFFDNRNMNLPFLLGYGLAVVIFYLVLGLPEEGTDLRYFAEVFVLVSLGEILLGMTVEKICGIYYWDYSALPLHLTRYTSMFTSIGFAYIITLFMRNCLPRIMNFFEGCLSLEFGSFSLVSFVVLVVDFFVSFGYMKKHRDFYRKWKVSFRKDDSATAHV